MLRTRSILVIFLAAALQLSALAQTASQPKHHKSRKPVKQLVLPPLPSGPLQPVPLDQLPSVPPQVNYASGKLTIVAENSSLGDILREVRKRTGASFDIPASANDRVATRIGPGPARDVLATLLNGTSFNYVMVGSANDPTALSSLVLTAKPAGAATTQTAQNQAPAYTAPDLGPGTGRPGFVPPQPVPPQTAENDDEKDDDEADNSDQDQQAEGQTGQPGQPGTPVPLPGQIQQPDQTDANGQPVNAGPRTPQQILQMLQQRNQQQQQQNQDQPPQQQ
jgi:hypothetical protein